MVVTEAAAIGAAIVALVLLIYAAAKRKPELFTPEAPKLVQRIVEAFSPAPPAPDQPQPPALGEPGYGHVGPGQVPVGLPSSHPDAGRADQAHLGASHVEAQPVQLVGSGFLGETDISKPRRQREVPGDGLVRGP